MIEKVNPSHPDKIADRIAGAIVDLAYQVQDDPKVAVEVLIGHGVCHAIAAAVREANKCKESGEEKVILFNLSGHGLIDMASYDQYLAGNLMNYELKDEDIQKNLDEIKDM